MLSSKLKLLLLILSCLTILIIPNIFLLYLIIVALFIFNLLFIYKYYYPHILFIVLFTLIFFGINDSLLIFVKLIIMLSLLSNYIKKTSIKKFKSNIYELIYILSKFNIDINKIANKITIFFYKPYFVEKQSNIIKKSLAIQGLDIYHSNSKGKFIVYKYIVKNITRLVKEEIQKVIAIL